MKKSLKGASRKKLDRLCWHKAFVCFLSLVPSWNVDGVSELLELFYIHKVEGYPLGLADKKKGKPGSHVVVLATASA